MSPPIDENKPSLHGHAARAVLSTERRIQIWDQMYSSFQNKIPAGAWCTRQELVKVSSGKHGVKFSVDELTEVIRGKKRKKDLGIDSDKLDGEWVYRFTVPDPEMVAAASKLSAASPKKHSTPSSHSKKRTPVGSPAAKRPTSTPSKAKPKATPKRNAPLRPRAKGPQSSSKTAGKKLPTSRKRNASGSAVPDDPCKDTPARTGVVKKPRVSPRSMGERAVPSPKGLADEVRDDGGSGGRGGAVKAGEYEDAKEERGWGCAVM